MASGLIWYRVLYSTGREESVLGLSGLERVLTRKVPRVIWYAEAIIHQCQVCGERGPWGPRWVGWERYKDRHEARGEGTDVYCSEICARSENPDFRWPSWMDVWREPRPIEVNRAIWRARDRERDRVRERSSHRHVPMPDWPGDGHCKWCAKPVAPPRRSWHAECYREYCLHSVADFQTRMLRQRDSAACAWPGCEARGQEVDHRIPLWSVDQSLPLVDLRWFYGPANIWLLCKAHHQAKTAREAAQRARERRLAADQLGHSRSAIKRPDGPNLFIRLSHFSAGLPPRHSYAPNHPPTGAARHGHPPVK